MFKVEQHFYYGWDDAQWTEGGVPLRFPTEAAGNTAIDELIADVANAVARGDMAGPYDRADYRVVPVVDSD